MTLEVAADRAGVALRQWQRVEAGEANITLKSMLRFARLFAVDVPELLRPLPRGSSR